MTVAALRHERPLSGSRKLARGRLRSRPRQQATCAACGCLIAHDHGGILCSPCRLRCDYDPRTDPQFTARLVAYLAAHVGRACNPTAHFAIRRDASYVVPRLVARLNATGWEIVPVRGRHGGYEVAAAGDGVRRRVGS